MLRFEPFYVAAPWGGRRLETEFNRTLPEGPVGEAWELVDLGERASVVREGPLQGKTLGELWRAGALGGSAQEEFPFLLKWLDTHDKLSVQVHADERSSAGLSGARPKTEAWFVAHTEPGASLYAGHYPGLDPATLKQAAVGGTIHKWLYETTPRVGDMLLVPAGTLHSIGGGFVFLEVQQPSETTYRLYDWERVGLDGQPRELHIDEACKAVNFGRAGALKTTRREVIGPSFAMRAITTNATLSAGPLRVVVCESTSTGLRTATGSQALEYGDVVVLEPDDGDVLVTSGTCLLLTEPSATAEPDGNSI